MGFKVESGNVTVDTENKNTPKSDISYRKFNVTSNTSLVEVMEALGAEGIPEEVKVKKDTDGETVLDKHGDAVLDGTSLTQLLADGFNRWSYTQAVAKAKETFNNSPEKTDSKMASDLKAIIANPETAPDRRKKAQEMLLVLSS